MKYTTKTVIGTVSMLMIVGMITSFVSSSETYFFGQKNVAGKVALRPVRNRSTAQNLQASILTSDVGIQATAAVEAAPDAKVSSVRLQKTTPKVQPAPRSCSEQNLYTYLGQDNGSLLYGMCIPCPMNKFNVQQKVCTQN